MCYDYDDNNNNFVPHFRTRAAIIRHSPTREDKYLLL